MIAWFVVICLLLTVGWTSRAGALTPPDTTAPAEAVSPDLADPLSLKVASGKTWAYPGETIPVTINLGYAADVTVRDIQYPRALHSGLSLRDAGPPSQGTEQRNGVSWSTMEFAYLISGAKAGEYVLGPVTLDCSLLQPSRSQGFFGGFEPQRRRLKAEGVAVTILPFPREGRPAGFTGAVGDFRLTVAVKPRSVKVGYPVTVTTTIAGDGNMETVACPAVAAEAGFSVYPPQARRQREEVICEQVLIPTDETALVAPVVAFSYFDPRLRSYRRVREGPFPVTVTGATGPLKTPPPLFPVMSGASAAPHADGRPTGVRAWLPVIFGMTCVALLGLLLRRRRVRTAPSSPREEQGIMHWESPPEPDAAILEAALAAQDSEQFYLAVFRTAQHIIGNHCQLPPRSVTEEIVETHLRSAGTCDVVIDTALTIFRECDRVRYGGARVGGEEMEATSRRVAELMRYFEIVRPECKVFRQ